MNTERMKGLFSDESFVKQLMEFEEPEQVQAFLVENDIDLTIQEIIQIREMAEKQINGEIDMESMSDDDLENVTGGIAFMTIMGIVLAGICLTGTAVGFAAGAAIPATHALTRRRW